MSKREAYPIETLLKLKEIDPNHEFEGADLEAWNEFVESNLNGPVPEEVSTKVKKTKNVAKPDAANAEKTEK